MKIDSYSFGEIVIDGKPYRSDVVACGGEVDPSWWRKAGHELNIEDLEDILRFEPAIVIVGTGNDGCMRVSPSTAKFLKEKGIELIVEKTKTACDRFNSIPDRSNVVFAAHLTC
jgi:hypothetical protein